MKKQCSGVISGKNGAFKSDQTNKKERKKERKKQNNLRKLQRPPWLNIG